MKHIYILEGSSSSRKYREENKKERSKKKKCILWIELSYWIMKMLFTCWTIENVERAEREKKQLKPIEFKDACSFTRTVCVNMIHFFLMTQSTFKVIYVIFVLLSLLFLYLFIFFCKKAQISHVHQKKRLSMIWRIFRLQQSHTHIRQSHTEIFLRKRNANQIK